MVVRSGYRDKGDRLAEEMNRVVVGAGSSGKRCHRRFTLLLEKLENFGIRLLSRDLLRPLPSPGRDPGVGMSANPRVAARLDPKVLSGP